MLNRTVLMGRLTRDPELRHTQTGTPVASFSLAVDRDFKDKTTGEKATDFIDIVAWRQSAEFVCKYFRKGNMIAVNSSLQTRNYEDKNGKSEVYEYIQKLNKANGKENRQKLKKINIKQISIYNYQQVT